VLLFQPPSSFNIQCSTPSVVALGPLVPSPTTFTLRGNGCVLNFLLALPIRRQPPLQPSLPSTPHSPSRFKGHHQTGVRRVQKVQLRRPTAPFIPPFSLFRDICFIEWLSLTLDLSIDSLHLYVLNCGTYYRSCFFLRSPPCPAVQLPPPTVVPPSPRRVPWPSP
jgi:hypothetical protein